MFAALSSTSRMVAISMPHDADGHRTSHFVGKSLSVEAGFAHDRRYIAVETRALVSTDRRRRHDHHRYARRLRRLAEGFDDFEAIYVRHHEVEHDEVGQFAPGHLDRLLTTERTEDGPGDILKAKSNELHRFRIIV